MSRALTLAAEWRTRLQRAADAQSGPYSQPTSPEAMDPHGAAMAAELVRLAEAHAWRPIESAPKGPLIWLWGFYWNGTDRFTRPDLGVWNPYRERWECQNGVWFGVRPTHWMPAPTPPEDTPT